MMSTSTVAEILRMDVAERLALVESIWDSITLFPDLVTPTDAQIAELDKRFRSYQKIPMPVRHGIRDHCFSLFSCAARSQKLADMSERKLFPGALV